MTVDLNVLAGHRNALFLAEAIGWLHDYRKCSEEHLQAQSPGSKTQALRRVELSKQQPNLQNISLALPTVQSSSRTITNLLDDKTWIQDTLGQFLSRCHNTAHFDKQEPVGGEQNYPGTQISSPFGFERPVGTSLTSRLWGLPWGKLAQLATVGSDRQELREKISTGVMVGVGVHSGKSDRQELREKISTLFAQTVADSRHPINEVDLWSWGSLVGALYKSALAGALLGYQPSDPHDLRWRLLSVRFDGLSFFAESPHIPDLLARRKLLDEALNRCRELLEVEFPLGTEVYRDENGSIFVVPGCQKGQCTLDLLALTDNSQMTLLAHLQEQVKAVIEYELVPDIKIDTDPWRGQAPKDEIRAGAPLGFGRNAEGQDPTRQRKDEIPPVSAHLQPITNATDAGWVRQQWDGRQEEICTVCGLRPQGPGEKAKGRKICDVCEKRRADRAKEWTKNLGTTIWTDEVADINGRLALVVGRFNLDHWLDGTLVQTLTVTDPLQDSTPDKRGVVRKSPSFARLRRVWETTRTFWQEVLPTDPERILANSLVANKVGKDSPRLEIIPENRTNLKLGPFHTYELVVNGIPLSVVWDDANKRFITCDNLDYLAKAEQMGRPIRAALEAQQGASLTLEEPVGYGAKNKVWGAITIKEVQELPDRYVPAIPILAEPRTFMALVPADKAMEVVKAIQEKYEREMGKVRNRLPLTLGVVYFGRRTPLAAALDAGRRMLQHHSHPTQAMVVSVAPQNPLSNTQWSDAVKVILSLNEQEITITVPAAMGDHTTPDVWYPYWQVKGKPSDRTRWFIGPDGEHWVHVCDLRQGDQVAFTPSTFDYEFLDTTARRFEVSYDASGQRRSQDRRQRPYLLEQLGELEQAWKSLSRLSKSQMYAVLSTIEAKRAMWQKPTGAEALALPETDVFRQFVGDTLREAGVYRDSLERAARSGMLRDAVEIHLEIMKEELKQEEPK